MENCVDLLDETVVVLFIPVEAQVFLPIEVIDAFNVAIGESLHNVDFVSVDGGECRHHL